MIGRPAPQMPDDFATFARTVGAGQLRSHYRAGGIAVRRWIAAQTPEWIAERERYLKQKNLTAMARGHADHRARVNATRPPKPAKASRPRTAKRNPLGYLGNDAPLADGIASRAAEHLKRATRFKPIFDAGKVYGKALAGVYVVGRLKMPTADMIALAGKHGFQSDWAAA